MATGLACELEPAAFNYIRGLVLKRAAIVLDDEKGYLVETRLAPIVREHGLASIEHLVDQLQSCKWSVLHQLVVEALTTNETSFFRDLHPFEALRHVVLPELLQKRAA